VDAYFSWDFCKELMLNGCSSMFQLYLIICLCYFVSNGFASFDGATVRSGNGSVRLQFFPAISFCLSSVAVLVGLFFNRWATALTVG